MSDILWAVSYTHLIYSESVYSRIYGTYECQVDGLGTMLRPSGDTITGKESHLRCKELEGCDRQRQDIQED